MVFRYEMELLVERSGMIINRIYGNYDESALGIDDPWTIYIIQKKV